MSHFSDKPLAVVHRLASAENPERLRASSDLFDAIALQGLTVVVSHGVGAFGNGRARLWTPGNTSLDPQRLEVDQAEIAVIRDVVGGLGRLDEAGIVERLADKVPIINGPEVRQGDDRRVALQIFDSLSPRAVVLDQTMDVDQIATELECFELGQVLDLCPARGKRNEGVREVLVSDRPQTASDIHAIITGTDGGFVLQGRVNGAGLPDYIQAQDDAERDRLSSLDPQVGLRIFWFFSEQNGLRALPVAKAPGRIDPKRWSYAALDPSSVPSELLDTIGARLALFAQTCAMHEMSGAVDLSFGTQDNEKDPTWYLQRANFCNPVPPSANLHPELRREFMRLTAEQIKRIADAQKPA